MASVGYYQNSHLATPPVGSIMRYLGANDPDGWIICNGTARTNNQDGRYNALNSLGIGTGGSGTSNYTPPDLQGQFSIGASSTYTLNSTGGSTSQSLVLGNIPSHTHGMLHQHFAGTNWGGTNYSNNYRIETAAGGTVGYCVDGTTTGVVTSSSTSPTSGSAGGATTVTTIPPYRALNYIIKY